MMIYLVVLDLLATTLVLEIFTIVLPLVMVILIVNYAFKTLTLVLIDPVVFDLTKLLLDVNMTKVTKNSGSTSLLILSLSLITSKVTALVDNVTGSLLILTESLLLLETLLYAIMNVLIFIDLMVLPLVLEITANLSVLEMS